MKKKNDKDDISAISKRLVNTNTLSNDDIGALKKAGREDIIVRHVMIKNNFMDLLFLDVRLKTSRGALPISIEESFWGKGVFYVAQSNQSVLIVGETGSGKEIMAKVLHDMSKQRSKEMISVSCIEIPETLFASELFGYKKGSHSLAYEDKKGLLEQANDNTLFMDEIGKMPPHVQAKLLRVIETKKVYPVGSLVPHSADFRILAAVQPGDLVDNKIIPDLLYRLSYPYIIKVPPLRERLKSGKGLPEKVLYDALRIAVKDLANGIPEILANKEYFTSEDTADILLKHPFEGNYRELVTVLKFAVLRAYSDRRDTILPEDLDFIKPSSAPVADNLESVPLKDIFDYADRKAASMIEEKVKQVLRSGNDIKNKLKEEGYEFTPEAFRGRFETYTGRKIGDIKREVRPI